MMAQLETTSPDVCSKTNESTTTQYKIAEGREERMSAYRLLHDGYVTKGLMVPNPSGLRVTPWQLQPSTQTYVAVEQGQVVYTMSLVFADAGMLPLEDLYVEEVAQIRATYGSVAEVTCLSSCPDHSRKKSFELFVNLVSLMFQQARHLGLDALAIAVHPRHASFYARQLGFELQGPQRTYPLVEDKPAQLCTHDFKALDNAGYPLFELIYETRWSTDAMRPRRISEADREYFQPFTLDVASTKCLALA